MPIKITFAPGFTGSKNVYALAQDNENLISDWQLMGTWTTATNPTVVSVSPTNGSGTPQTFSATFSSNLGATDLNTMYLLVNTSVYGVGACLPVYVRSANALYLINDAGNGYVPGAV